MDKNSFILVGNNDKMRFGVWNHKTSSISKVNSLFPEQVSDKEIDWAIANYASSFLYIPSKTIIAEAKRTDADIIALSALMTTTMQEMKEIVRLKKEAGIRAKIMIGGAVTTQAYADEIGADGYSANARDAALTARRLLGLEQDK